MSFGVRKFQSDQTGPGGKGRALRTQLECLDYTSQVRMRRRSRGRSNSRARERPPRRADFDSSIVAGLRRLR
jgi:hypothetical protein